MQHCKFQSPIQPLFLLLLVFLTAPSLARADVVQAEQWEISADKITRYEEPPSVIAEGNVVLTKQETVTRQKKAQSDGGWSALLGESGDATPEDGPEDLVSETKTLTTIKSDWMVYDVDLAKVRARGNVYIEIGPDQLTAETGTVDLNRQTGTFENATIIREYKDMHFEGRVIEKTGDLTYHIEDGWIVTCKLKDGETAPWSFAAADADITDGGYAFLKHATFRVKGVPIMYTPIMILPAKRTRQTGFLFPSITSSDRDGFGFEIPFFVNLSPSSDMTLYPQYLQERGFMAGAEFRYVLDETAKGTLLGNYLDDDLSDPSEVDYYADGNFTHTNQDRYWLRGKADQNFGSWVTRLDMDIVSDRDYLTEFNTGFTGFTTTHERLLDVYGRGLENKTDDQRENTFRTLRSWDNGTALEAEVLGINDVRADKTSPTPLWRLPALTYTGLLPVAETGVDFSWDAGYVYYWREEGVGAQRIDLFPQLTTSVPLSQYLETTVTTGIRDTAYLIQDNGDPDWADTSSENRFLYNFNTEIGTTLMRDFGVSMGDVDLWKHTFRPFVGYTYVSDDDQEDLPQFDSIDLVSDENVVYYGIDNFFDIFGKNGDRSFERQYALLKIYQGYDLRSEMSDEPWTPINVRMDYYPLNNFRFIYRTDIDVYEDGMYYHSVEADYRSGRGDIFSLDYRYNELTAINSISGSAWLILPYNFAAGYSLERSIEDSQTVEENIRLVYQPACWSVELASQYTPSDQKIMLMFRLANIGNPFGVDFPGF